MKKAQLTILAAALLSAAPLAAHFPPHRPGPWRHHHRAHRPLPWPWHNTARMTLACYSGQLTVFFSDEVFCRHTEIAPVPRRTVSLAVNFGQNSFEYKTLYYPVRFRRPAPPPRMRPHRRPAPPPRMRPHRRPVPPPAVRPAPRPARYFAPRPPAGRAQFGLTPSPRPARHFAPRPPAGRAQFGLTPSPRPARRR